MQTLLKLLGDGAFHSGEDLGLALGVTRSAVWKKLQQVEAEFGIEIHKVRGRGYRLANPLSLLHADRLTSEHADIGWSCNTYDVLDSTNAQAMRAINSGAELPLLILAEQQTAGRGRRGRNWVSPFGENLYYSVALRLDGGMRRLEGLSLLVGLAVVKTLREMGVEDAGLKWPNDILVGHSKMAGVLLELTGDPADVCHVVIGVGININMREADSVGQSWTSLALELGRLTDRNDVACSLSRHLRAHLDIHQKSGFAYFREEWERNHLWQGQKVSLLAGDGVVDGVVLGIGADGALRLQVGDNEQHFSGGEMSLRLQGSL